MKTISLAVSVFLLLARTASPQTIAPSATKTDTTTPSPILIPLDGSVRTSNGTPRTGQVQLHVALYAAENDREPLATEDQLITLGVGGTYRVWFGATLSEGLPANLFTESGGRWVGISIDNGPELPRTMIVVVPYAARAASALALGSKTEADFVLSENLRQTLQQWGYSPSKSTRSSGGGGFDTMSLSTGDPTTPNAIAKYVDNIGTFGEAAMFEVGGNVGIGTNGPARTLDVNGQSRFRDAINLGSVDDQGLISWGTTFGPSTVIRAGTGNNLWLGANNSNSAGILVTTSGNVGIGNTSPTAKLHVGGDIIVQGNIAAKYQDVAEWVDVAEPLAAGTVVAAHPTRANHVRRSMQAYDTTVLGVVSYQPGLLLGEKGDDKVAVAQSGRVKVRVDARYGAIKPGDLLVASPTPGVAMRSRPTRSGLHRPGTIIGKALEPLPSGTGEILVLLTLQ